MTGRPRLALAVMGVLGAALLGGCAPHVAPGPPRLTGAPLEARFAARLAERATGVAVVEGDYSAWARRAGAADAPGVSVRVRLVAPNAFRLRVDALLGTAIEAAAHRDTLVLDAPVFGIAAVTDAGEDRSRRQDLGEWAWRALGATWTPPPRAWAAGEPGDSAWIVRWVEAGDSLALEVSPDGLPRRAHVGLAAGGGVTIRYDRWATWDGVMWPARIVAGDDAGRLSVTLQPSSLALKAHDAAARAALRVPSRATRMSRAKLLGWIERLALAAGADSTDVGGR